MNLLEIAKERMSSTVEIGTNGLKLIGHTEEYLRHSDAIILIMETIDEDYQSNMVDALHARTVAERVKPSISAISPSVSPSLRIVIVIS